MEGGGNPSKECYSPKASRDDHEPTDDVAGNNTGGRFYECTFCRRGFSTAQALGGHMNIHRKDRAKKKHNSSPASVIGDQDEHMNDSNHPPLSESLRNYGMLLDSASHARVKGREENVIGSLRTREMSLFGEELNLGLRVHGEGRHPVLGREERRVQVEEEVEVNLELRLGHEP